MRVTAAKALDDFEDRMGRQISFNRPKRPSMAGGHPRSAFPPAESRKIIYTADAIESLNRVIRKTTKTRGSFPTETGHQLTSGIRFRKGGSLRQRTGRNQFAILYPERFNK